MQDDTVTDLESATSSAVVPSKSGVQAWIKLGALAAASALAGGLAAAWYYRKTLDRLREAESSNENPNFEIPEDESED